MVADECIVGAARAGFNPAGAADLPAQQDRLHRTELSRSRSGKPNGCSTRTSHFFKSTSAIVGPNDPLRIPRGAQKIDWEVELAVVVGKKASYVSEDQALGHVAGFVLHNDYSERSFQLARGGQWVKGKSADTFAPLGPFLATPGEVANLANLAM